MLKVGGSKIGQDWVNEFQVGKVTVNVRYRQVKAKETSS